ncbi:hypothetical protein [Aquabacterium olei]|uniref:hypothetical protein n=1 Tax=Aquabacterium olei TaxID=1296669 RepID=UPI00131F365C|nr:hypothetical protein [Aquabacterium olei]
MKKIGPTEIMSLVKQIQANRDVLFDEKLKLGNGVYAAQDFERDARLTVYSKLINSCNSLQLALTLMSSNLMNLDWWKAIARSPIPEPDVAIYVKEFDSFSKIGFVQSIFSAIESSLRIYLRALAPSACSNGTSEFKSIYECLFKTQLSAEPADGVVLLDLLRNVRNTIHNNGVFFNKAATNQSISWKGKQFLFEYSKPVDFVTWDFLLEVVTALEKMIGEIVNDSKLTSITTGIIDPYAP